MPREPLRFIHAADCLLDSPLRDLGPLPEELLETATSATLTAFEQVVAACLEREIDFLLLTGNIFDESEQSLAARVAIIDGCRLLADGGIDILVWPGERDPWAAWESIPDLPPNVVLLSDEPGDVVEITRDGRAIAEIAGVNLHDSPAARDAVPGASEHAPFAIGLVCRTAPGSIGEQIVAAPLPAGCAGIDYLALSGGPRRTTRSHLLFAHHPGPTQGLSAIQTGPHGCTFVEVDADGISRAAFVSTAAVRREQFPLAVEEFLHREDLIESMARAIGARRPEPGERLWLCEWRVVGAGRLFRQLNEEGMRDELIAELSARGAHPRGVAVHHEFRLVRGSSGETPVDPQAAEYFALLEEEGTIREEIPAEWPIERDRLDSAAVLGHARHFGEQWPAARIEEEAAT